MKNKEIARKPQGGNGLAKKSSSSEISSFLQAARAIDTNASGRLIFAMDATMSRQPSWDRAMTIQASMFDAVGKTGGLSVQLVYFRGIDECRASKWVINARALRDLMIRINCLAGPTQIGKILSHAQRENSKQKVSAMVYIGDCLEESVSELYKKSGELGLLGVRCFFFQEGTDRSAESGFREMAGLTGGAYHRLGPDSARELAGLLRAVAVYAQGGLQSLISTNTREATLLLEQIKR
jgi:hypothetical protein